MKFTIIVASILSVVSAIKISDVIPAIPAVAEKPNQYNRVCDLVAPNNEGCK